MLANSHHPKMNKQKNKEQAFSKNYKYKEIQEIQIILFL